jgi:ATP-dependent Lhr-like helicase
LDALVANGRALFLRVTPEKCPKTDVIEGWTTQEHFSRIQVLFTQIEILAGIQDACASEEEKAHSSETASLFVVQGWMPHIGPVTSQELADRLGIASSHVHHALLQLESQGQVLRGRFRPIPSPSPYQDKGKGKDEGVDPVDPLHLGGEGRVRGEAWDAPNEEWCDRSLLARIHRRTVTALRREIEPVAASDFMRFLFRWHHCAPRSQLHGEVGLREIIGQLAGYETPASAWESSLLKVRIANYKPEWLDNLCLRGEVSWGRLTPPAMKPNLRPVVEGESFRRMTPTSMAPISFVRREDVPWILTMARPGKSSGPLAIRFSLSGVAQAIYACLDVRGACFFADLTNRTGHLAAEVEQALWELVAGGLVTADGFDPLRAMIDPRRRRAVGKERARRPRHSAGRWALLESHSEDSAEDSTSPIHPHEQWAKQVARRYGVVFRDLLKRESLPVTWRELLVQYRKMEWRGEMRGGRFVDGFTGEQFALPEAVEALRAVRRDPTAGAQEIRLSPADPLNLVGIILPGACISSHTSQPILFRDGVQVSDSIPIMSLA